MPEHLADALGVEGRPAELLLEPVSSGSGELKPLPPSRTASLTCEVGYLTLRRSVSVGIGQVGCHSAKFANEKDTANIREAIARYDIKHPVVNDRDMAM